MKGGSTVVFRNSRKETSLCAALRFFTRSLMFRVLPASAGVPGGSGKCFVFPQHGAAGCDALEDPCTCVFSMPQ